MSRDALTDLAESARRLGRDTPAEIRALARTVALARYFDHNVTRGGFAQLIYNLEGELLRDLEAMLTAVGAPVAREHYVRAISLCLQDLEAYQRFLKSPFPTVTTTKDALHRASLDYFAQGVEFPTELAPWLGPTRARLTPYFA